jgi:glycerol-3-phosphate O-acyltransferase
MELEYYKNTIIHYFINHALVAIAILGDKGEEKSFEKLALDYEFLRQLLQREFMFAEEAGSFDMDAVVDDFCTLGLITCSDQKTGYSVTGKGFDRLPIWAELAKTFLESYWIAAWSLSQHDNQAIKRGDILKNINALGKQFYKSGVIQHIGALSQLTYKNAMLVIDRMEDQTLMNAEAGPTTRHERLSKLSRKIYELAHY